MQTMDVVKKEPSETPNVTPVDIQAMMAAARRQIEEHKMKNGLVSKPVASADRIAELTAQINARLKPSIQSILAQVAPPTAPGMGKPAPLILNAEGRTVDSSGKEVQLVQRIPTLKANIRAQKTEPILKISQDKSRIEDDKSEFVDFRVEAKAPVRPKRSFNFHEKGKFETEAKRMRTKVMHHLRFCDSFLRLEGTLRRRVCGSGS